MADADRTRSLLAATALVATVATAGSLYFSEVMGLVPCDLCWYQRILMYPLVVVAGVAAVERRASVWRTGLPLSLSGVVVAAYHSSVQLRPAATCGVDGACTAILWRGGVVFTIPRLALVAFALISVGFGALALIDRGRLAP
ncbi:disulfide bond formation protein B [Halorubrum sp. DTA98]|uniref:disulfide bond formation protein B n=1 Tax=Halorubrum sp. DTA98 TaxID=3402163 RepID=UPI003AB0BBB4